MVQVFDTEAPIMLSRTLVLSACPAFAKPSAPATDSCDLAVDVTQAPWATPAGQSLADSG
jgi:hypothetical protein